MHVISLLYGVLQASPMPFPITHYNHYSLLQEDAIACHKKQQYLAIV
ncbi:MAG: hypothetical protein ACI9SC_001445 [Gammaproteobacteria bacterium]